MSDARQEVVKENSFVRDVRLGNRLASAHIRQARNALSEVWSGSKGGKIRK
jgi:hypothetical protein